MFRKLFTFGVLATVSLGTLVTAGCATGSNQPYGLTGVPDRAEQQRWTDSKGRYHPEWRNGINTPVGYPK